MDIARIASPCERRRSLNSSPQLSVHNGWGRDDPAVRLFYLATRPKCRALRLRHPSRPLRFRIGGIGIGAFSACQWTLVYERP